MKYANMHWYLRKLCKPEVTNELPILPFSSSKSSLSIGTFGKSSSSSGTEEDSIFPQRRGRPKGTSIEKSMMKKIDSFMQPTMLQAHLG